MGLALLDKLHKFQSTEKCCGYIPDIFISFMDQESQDELELFDENSGDLIPKYKQIIN